MFFVGEAGAEERLGGDLGIIMITVRRDFVGLGGLEVGLVVIGQTEAFFVRRADVQLRLWGHGAVGPAFDDLLVHLDGLVH